MTCQLEGCKNPLKNTRARFCSGACKVAAHRKKPATSVNTTYSNVVKGNPAITAESLEAAGKTMIDSAARHNERMAARTHAVGCPCWTCKGVPSKPKPKKP